jgi:TolB protein
MSVPSAWAQFRVEISGVGATQIPVAVARFRGEEAASPSLGVASQIVRADLERSGLFRLLDAPSVIEETTQPSMPEWRGRGADALVGGSVARLADGRLDVRYKLWDVVKGADLGGQSLAVPLPDMRLAAHRVADAVYERLTGDKGVFSTRIAYVTRAQGRYTLRIADADGEGGQVALASPDPIISPAWSPDGRELAYVSFESQKAVVWVQDVASGQRRPIANFRGSNSAPAWSPDGQQIALTLSQAGGSQLFVMPRTGGSPRRLTQSSAIDTEATWAPDGRSIVFVSDRGGGPQVYRIAATASRWLSSRAWAAGLSGCT